MARGQTTEEVKEDIRRAHVALRDDIAALDQKLHADVATGVRAALGIAAVGLAIAALAMFGRRKKQPPKRRKR